MRNLILLSLATLVLGSCQKEEEPQPRVNKSYTDKTVVAIVHNRGLDVDCSVGTSQIEVTLPDGTYESYTNCYQGYVGDTLTYTFQEDSVAIGTKHSYVENGQTTIMSDQSYYTKDQDTLLIGFGGAALKE